VELELQRKSPMRLLVYAAPSDTAGRDLRKSIRSSRLDAWTETTFCPSLAALDQQLRKPLGPSPIGVLMPSDTDQLAALLGMRHLLRGMRLILILPAIHQPDIVHARAHMLRPRFITYADKNLQEVTAVLWKMVEAVCGVAV
jgi:hypothetical protein